MPVDVRALWEADGWGVLECDGHSFEELYAALRDGVNDEVPTVIICHTQMGKDVSYMEGVPDYHGKAPNRDQYEKAVRELGGNLDYLEKAKARRGNPVPSGRKIVSTINNLLYGEPRTYGSEKKTDNRSAFGNALADVGTLNYKREEYAPSCFRLRPGRIGQNIGFRKKLSGMVCSDWHTGARHGYDSRSSLSSRRGQPLGRIRRVRPE